MSGMTAFAVSPEQERCWALAFTGIPLGYRVLIEATGIVAEAELRRAVTELVHAHEILRTRVVVADGRPVQVIDDAGAALLWDVRRTGDEAWEIRFEVPATVADRQTAYLLLDALSDCFAGSAAPAELQYADIAAWLADTLEDQPAGNGQSGPLSPVTPALLAPRLPFEARGTEVGANHVVSRAAPVELGHRPAATGDAVMLVCWQILLGRLTGSAERVPAIAVATPTRQRPEVRRAFGPMTRYLPVGGAALNGPVPELVAAVEDALAATADCVYSFAWPTQYESGWPDGLLPYSPYAFAIEHWPAAREVRGVTFALAAVTGCAERFAVELGCVRRDGEILLELRYDAVAIPDGYAEVLIDQYVAVLAGVLQGATSVADVPLIDAERRRALLDSGVVEPIDDVPDVLGDIAAWAEKTPDAVAVMDGCRETTYAELVAAASGLAGGLRDAGIGNGEPVAVSLDRGTDAVTAALAVLWAGGAYAPVDRLNPAARIRAMLGSLAPRVSITDLRAVPAVSGGAPAPAVAVGEQTAYVIHTSGSTGAPRPVAIPHRALRNRLSWSRSVTPLCPNDRVLMAAGLGFDFSVWEILAPLCAGASVLIADEATYQNPAALARLMRDGGVTVAHFTPALLDLVAREPDLAECGSLRLVLSGGDALTADTVKRLAAASGAELINQYGPTEAAIDVTYWRCARDATGTGVPIGVPGPGCDVRVLDDHFSPTPVGVPGEIHIGGAALANGYLALPGETATRFVADPYRPGTRMYRTGDAGRTRWDGAVEFLGRLDDEISLRGYRIHLGDVEAALRTHAAVSSCAVVMTAAGGAARLVGYFVPLGTPPSGSELRDFLSSLLPAFMVPEQFAAVDMLPLNPAGKVDRSALTEVAPAAARAGYRAPVTEVELVVAQLWLARLRDQAQSLADRIGLDDDFFELGGHSLVLLGLLADLRDALGVEVPLTRLVKATTVAAMAAVVVECEQQPGQATRVAKLWLRVNAMSGDEAAGLLAAKTSGKAESQ